MLDLIKKSLFTSLGAVLVTKEKVEKTAKRLVDEGKISPAEAERLCKEFMESGQFQWQEFQKKIIETIRKTLENLDVPTRQDIETLKKDMKALRKRLERIENEGQSPQDGNSP